MVSEAELQPISHVTKSLLYSIINLCVRVRSFSLAKDIIEKYKVNAKETKAKAWHYLGSSNPHVEKCAKANFSSVHMPRTKNSNT